MTRLNYHKSILTVLMATCLYAANAQQAAVAEKVITPLPDPKGTNYSSNSLNVHIGYTMPLFNTNQANTLFWNTGGYHFSIASNLGLSKRFALSYQIGYTRVHFGKTTNDSLGTTFFSYKSITSTNLIDITAYLRIFLGKTFYQPSVDIGLATNYNFNTRIIHQGKYLPQNASAGLKYEVDAFQKLPIHAMLRMNIAKMYFSGKYFIEPLFDTPADQIKWQTQIGIGLRF